MIKYILLIALILLSGCERVVYQNTVINNTVEIVREVPKEIIKIEYVNVTVPDIDCRNSLRIMVSRLDYMQDRVDDLMMQNNTLSVENLTNELQVCNYRFADCNESLFDIREALK